MYVTKMSYSGYRNLKDDKVTLNSNVNIVYGENAQGKTNFLETVWLLTGGHSFRGSRDADLIHFDSKIAEVKGDFFSQGRNQSIRISMQESSRRAYLNEVDKGRTSRIVGEFKAVIFSPMHLSIIKGGPENRRRLLDTIICQLKPTYVTTISRYNHILRSRNALLKEMNSNGALDDLLEVWDKKLAQYGAIITKERVKYVNLLGDKVKDIYDGISSGREKLWIKYRSGAVREEKDLKDTEQKIMLRLEESREYDKKTGYTSKGPHRDDFEFYLDGKAVKDFGSQGQQRSSVLSLKLAEACIMEEESGEKPVILLDDVMSELDAARQDYIINYTKGWQVIITSCEMLVKDRLKAGKILKIHNGEIVEEKMM